MIFRKSYRNKGVILADIMLAMALSVLFVTVITYMFIDTHLIFDHAKERSALIDYYENENGSTTISNKLYGNEMLETTVRIEATSSIDMSQSVRSSLQFSKIMMSPITDLIKVVGTPLCSVNYLDNFNSVPSSSTLPTISIKQIALPINSLIPLTDLEVRNGIAYISADSVTSADPDIFIVDIRDENNPIIKATLNTGPGIASLVLVGKHIFAASQSSAAQLHTIRIDGSKNSFGSTTMSLSLENKFKLPLPYATATPPLASSITYHDGKVYLGTEKWDGDELNIIDVSNTPNPIKIGGLEVGSKISDILIHNNLAYIANASQQQLIVVDIHNPASPHVINSFSPSGWSRQEGKAVSVFEDQLNFARTSGGYNIAQDHEAFAWRAIDSTTLDVSSLTGSIDISGGVYGIIADRSRFYLATRQLNKELRIFDDTFTASTSRSFSLPAATQMMTCDGDNIYVLAHTAPSVYKISK